MTGGGAAPCLPGGAAGESRARLPLPPFPWPSPSSAAFACLSGCAARFSSEFPIPRAARAGELRAACPHIHEFACELLRLADRKRFPQDSRFDQETEIRKGNRHRWTLPAPPGPRKPRRPEAAATVLLGIRGLLVTAVTQTPDGQTLVEVIADGPGRGGRAVLPAVRPRRPGSRSVPGPRPVTCSSGTGRSCWTS